MTVVPKPTYAHMAACSSRLRIVSVSMRHVTRVWKKNSRHSGKAVAEQLCGCTWHSMTRIAGAVMVWLQNSLVAAHRELTWIQDYAAIWNMQHLGVGLCSRGRSAGAPPQHASSRRGPPTTDSEGRMARPSPRWLSTPPAHPSHNAAVNMASFVSQSLTLSILYCGHMLVTKPSAYGGKRGRCNGNTCSWP